MAVSTFITMHWSKNDILHENLKKKMFWVRMNQANAWKGELEVAIFLPSKSIYRQCVHIRKHKCNFIKDFGLFLFFKVPRLPRISFSYCLFCDISQLTKKESFYTLAIYTKLC